MTEKKIARIIRSILRFIAQCHAKGVIYRDVKPDNFLFLSKEDNSPLRATDFGLSIRCAGTIKRAHAPPPAWSGKAVLEVLAAMCMRPQSLLAPWPHR